MSRPPRGGSMGELFMPDVLPHVRPDGHTIRRLVQRCRWCFALVTDIEEALTPGRHEPGCRVGALLADWHRAGQSPAVIDQFDAIVDQLDAADGRRPS